MLSTDGVCCGLARLFVTAPWRLHTSAECASLKLSVIVSPRCFCRIEPVPMFVDTECSCSVFDY